MRKQLSVILVFAGILFGTDALAQCDTISNVCNRHLGNTFISDGQEYRALLIDKEVAEFTTTFYGGSVYRITTCSGYDKGTVVFRVYDSERHLLFSSADFNNVPYWDFKFTSTVNCTIEAQLVPNTPTQGDEPASGCVVILIGFKTSK